MGVMGTQCTVQVAPAGCGAGISMRRGCQKNQYLHELRIYVYSAARADEDAFESLGAPPGTPGAAPMELDKSMIQCATP